MLLNTVGLKIFRLPSIGLVELGHEIIVELLLLFGDAAGGADAAVQAHFDIITLLLRGGDGIVGAQTVRSESGDAGEVAGADVLGNGIVIAADGSDLLAEQSSDLLTVAVVGDVIDVNALGLFELQSDDVVDGADAGAAKGNLGSCKQTIQIRNAGVGADNDDGGVKTEQSDGRAMGVKSL